MRKKKYMMNIDGSNCINKENNRLYCVCIYVC